MTATSTMLAIVPPLFPRRPIVFIPFFLAASTAKTTF
jgi:hypothetical protein